jgi:ribosomal-protein-alanine N-acetyltransferase
MTRPLTERARAEYSIEAVRPEDVPEVWAVEQIASPHPWSRPAFERELEKSFSFSLLARGRSAPPVAGYCVYWVLFEEMTVQNLAVHPAHRGRGLGRLLLESALGRAVRCGARSAELEVRESNRVARSLYASFGFKAVGKRKLYYASPVEDAVLYRLDPAPGGGIVRPPIS